MKSLSIGLNEALGVTLEQVRPLGQEIVELGNSTDRIVAANLDAKVDSPSIDSSLKDGYAVMSGEVAGATPEMPVRLEFAGQLSAGEETALYLKPGTTVRVLTGARLPSGADAVLSEEFTKPERALHPLYEHFPTWTKYSASRK